MIPLTCDDDKHPLAGRHSVGHAAWGIGSRTSETAAGTRPLFPACADLHTAANGDITRSVSGHDLPFDAFSTEESMGAAIIVRLLAAQMATGTNVRPAALLGVR